MGRPRQMFKQYTDAMLLKFANFLLRPPTHPFIYVKHSHKLIDYGTQAEVPDQNDLGSDHLQAIVESEGDGEPITENMTPIVTHFPPKNCFECDASFSIKLEEYYFKLKLEI